ncbi:MAG: DUF4266 domain-containing protein [Rubrivivax sp.]
MGASSAHGAALCPAFTRAARGVAALTAALLATACSAPQPWVKPYERERLADPLMQFSRTALTEKHREHVHLVREGARGATGVQGGGCGCN